MSARERAFFIALEERMDKWITADLEVKDDGAGTVQSAFSVFNVIDSDGDVVKPSAFKDGQEVPMVWSHKWDAPIGKGTVHVGRKQATFDGHFFLDTQAIQNKAMAYGLLELAKDAIRDAQPPKMPDIIPVRQMPDNGHLTT